MGIKFVRLGKKKVQIDLDSVPSTVEAAVDAVVSGFSTEELKYLTGPSLRVPVAALYRGLGMNLRNAWSLWDSDTPIKRDAVKNYSISHADDISGLILSWAFAKVHNDTTFDPHEHVKRYHMHWGSPEAALKAGG